MLHFKIIFDNWATIIKAANLTAAQDWVGSYKPDTAYVIEEIIITTPPNSISERVSADLFLGKKVILEFLIDNEITPATPTEAINMLVKFQSAKALLETGAIVQARAVIASLTVDTLFTQLRKDKYLAIIDAYLALYL